MWDITADFHITNLSINNGFNGKIEVYVYNEEDYEVLKDFITNFIHNKRHDSEEEEV